MTSRKRRDRRQAPLRHDTEHRFYYTDRLKRYQIRLLDVSFGEGQERVKCHLTTSSIGGAGKPTVYHALSYVWGNPMDTRLIECDGQLVSITSNLYDALLQYRAGTCGTFLWVDALCINQTDEMEKTAQVQAMMSIYEKAEMVICWLGTPDQYQPMPQASSKLAFEVFHSIYHAMELSMVSNWAPVIQTINQRLLEDDAAIYSVIGILERPWFKRIWILQELVMATRSVFWCGNQTVDSKVVTHFGWYIESPYATESVRQRFSNVIPNDAENEMQNIRAFHTLRDYRSDEACMKPRRMITEMGFAELLRTTQRFEATDPRDKFFATVRLSRDVDGDSIIDYRQDHGEVLFNVARQILLSWKNVTASEYLPGVEDRGQLDLLHYAGKFSTSPTQPSWIPTWDEHKGNIDHEDTLQFPIVDHPNGLKWFRINADRSLSVKGILTDSVIQLAVEEWVFISDAFVDYAPGLEGRLQSTTNFLDDCEKILVSISPIQEVDQPLWRALAYWHHKDSGGVHGMQDSYTSFRQYLADAANLRTGSRTYWWLFYLRVGTTLTLAACVLFPNYHRRLGIDHVPFILLVFLFFYLCDKFLTFFVRYLSKSFTLHPPRFQDQMNEKARAGRKFHEQLAKFSRGRRFAFFRSGFCGWVPRVTEQSDKIVLIDGAQLPLVMRPVGKDGYELIGSAYILNYLSPRDLRGMEDELREIRII